MFLQGRANHRGVSSPAAPAGVAQRSAGPQGSCCHTARAPACIRSSVRTQANAGDQLRAQARQLLHGACATISAVSLLAGSTLLAPSGALPSALARPRLTQEEQLTVDIFKKATPSVVNVTNLAVKRDQFTMNMLELPQGQGSGFIWDTTGHVVTNYHVITEASDIKVTLAGGEEFSARVVGVDQDKDIAVLMIGPLGPKDSGLPRGPGDGAEKPPLKPLGSAGRNGTGPQDGAVAGGAASLAPGVEDGAETGDAAPGAKGGAGGGSRGDGPGSMALAASRRGPELPDLNPLSVCSSSADLVVGQKVYAIGNPFGLDHTLTTGVVSGTGREIQSISGRPIQDVIQTDAAINPGNSGGPLLDSGGCLIGINTAIYSPSGANSGVGFAIPVDVVKSSVQQIIQYGKVTRPILGISFAPDMSSEPLGIKGILVLSAKEGGPAWKAGIKGTTRDEYGRLVLGDIITGVNGTKVKSSSDLYRILDKCQVGDELELQVLRESTTVELKVTLEPNSA